jgi:choice-of-anchor C domain-containing protein
MRLQLAIRILGPVVLSAAASQASAAAFQNGSFESVVLGSGVDYATLAAGSGSLSGWTIEIGSVDHIRNYWQPAAGQQSVDLFGSEQGRILQTFDTTPGQQYQVSFQYSVNPDGGGATRGVIVAALDGGSTLFQNNYAYAGSATRNNMDWLSQSFEFTATGAQTTLRFGAYDVQQPNQCCYGAALDNVQVAAVPEAHEWAMMLAGLGLVGWIAGRRRSTGAIA